MANTLRFKRGLVSGIPTAALGEPLFTTDTFDLYIGNGTGNTRFQKYIASGTTSQLLRGDGSLLTMPIVLTSPSNGQVLKYNGTSWVNDSDAGITGSGVAGQVAYFTGATTQSGSNNLFWDATNNRLGIGTNTPSTSLHVLGSLGSFQVYASGAEIAFTRDGNNAIGAAGGASAQLQIRATNNLQFHTGSTLTERARIFTNGNFVINSTTDSGQRLQVTGTSYFSDSVGIGSTSLTNISLRISKTITGITTGNGIWLDGQIQSDVTSSYRGFRSTLNIVNSTFTLANVYHVLLEEGTIGASSTVTNQYGIFLGNLTKGGSNFGIYNDVSAGTNKWGYYGAGTANNYMAGSLLIGSTSLTTRVTLRLGKNITGGGTSYGILNDGQVQSDVNVIAFNYDSQANTASAFTLSDYVHYRAAQATLNGTVTTQTGFLAHSSLTGATNNYGFYGNIAAATGRWNLYMNGSADNYMAGSLGIGSTNLTGVNLSITKSITGSLTSSSVIADGVINSDVTTTAFIFRTRPSTQAASFALGNLTHYSASINTIGAGSSITNQIGFSAGSDLIGATNNYGFYGDIASGTGRWNLYMGGTANNYLAGNLGIGITTPAGNLDVYNATSSSIYNRVGAAGANWVTTSTQSQIGTYTNHNFVIKTNDTARINITNGGNVLIYSTTDLGQKLQVTGTSYFSDSVGIGTASSTIYSLRVGKTIVGAANSGGIYQDGTVQSTVTSGAFGFYNSARTQAASFTLTNYYHYYADQFALGAGSSITNQYGYVADSTLTSATNNFGFYGNIAAATGRWNLYMNGTAANYLAGSLSVGTTSIIGEIHARGGSGASVTPMITLSQNGDLGLDWTAGVLNFYSQDTSTNSAGGIGHIRVAAQTAYNTGTTPSYMAFYTHPAVANNNTALGATVERMRLDASGNLGLGVTPSAWGGFRALDIGTTGSFVSFTSSPNAQMVANMFWTGSAWQYKTTGGASRVSLNANAIEFWNAASGTGGATITTLTQAMTLFATGNLAVGTTTDAGFRLDVNGTMRVSGASTFNGNVSLVLNQNATTFSAVTNTDVGVNSKAEFQAFTRNGGTTKFGRFSNLATAYKIINASDGYALNETLGDFAILNDNATGSIKMAAGGSSTAHFTIASTGAATFSSSVTAGGNLLLSTGTASSVGAINLIRTGSSPVASRITFGTDGTGYSIAIGKNQGGTTTDLLTILDSGASTFSSTVTSTQFNLSALNTAPATSSSTGTLGEIRIDANHIYVCTATNTWKRVAIATF